MYEGWVENDMISFKIPALLSSINRKFSRKQSEKKQNI
jgi:hypothetical protein